jgi:ribonuclease D
VDYQLVDSDSSLANWCAAAAGARRIAFDTEFISERSFRPQLCLIQTAVDGELAIFDPLKITDLNPFWQTLADGQHTTIVHAGREELSFSLRAIGRHPANLVDLQIAAGLVATDYPAGYSSLLWKILGHKLHKHETRTDWSRRPLSPRQLQYALDDVLYLETLYDNLLRALDELGRRSWLDDEMADWQREIDAATTGERWQRVGGIANLSPRSLAIVREVWRWRETVAERRDTPVRHVIRDDLIVELARLQSADENRISHIRGLDRRDLTRAMPHLLEAIERALDLPDDECPRLQRSDSPSQLQLVAQLLTSILNSVCRAASVSVGLVGTVQDVRDLVAFHLGVDRAGGEPPKLARGWRAQIVGQVLEDLLAGRTCIRIADPMSDDPLAFEPRPNA